MLPLSRLAIVVMTKHPTPGKVKTRLTPDLTFEQAVTAAMVALVAAPITPRSLAEG